ncbi:IS66 family insertion sequence element accessory protein TnpA [Nibricoccus sp. IMCC34717]|uniref:IS66 family insertion sequence element accessory protein TnpA n=1 Tax=Nibricoccus sp. IMCC34717 TaxID=3034021 RepID=UPI00384B8BEB
MGAITAEVVDTGEKRDTSGRRVSNAERRREMVEAYRASGLTMAAFARRERINYATFAGWVAKAASGKLAKAPIHFAEVALPHVARGAERLEVRFADGTIVRGERVAEVAALVRALRT